jgi:hypothetical protein
MAGGEPEVLAMFVSMMEEVIRPIRRLPNSVKNDETSRRVQRARPEP